jgi:type IV pilus assembly protein PilF
MIRRMQSLCWLVFTLALAGCTGVQVNDGGNRVSNSSSASIFDSSAGVGDISRPMSEITPSTPTEIRASVRVELGMAYLGNGHADVALDEARRALREISSYAPAHHLMGLAYMMLGENAKADEAFRHALSSAPGDPDFNNSYGWFLCLHGREQEAFPRFLRAARNPYYRYQTRPHTNAGLCYVRLKNDAAAEAEFSRALELDPGNAGALYQIAAINYRRGDFRATYEQLARFHQQRPPSAASIWLGLRTARKLNEHNAQASYAEQLRQRFANSPEYALLLQGKFDE